MVRLDSQKYARPRFQTQASSRIEYLSRETLYSLLRKCQELALVKIKAKAWVKTIRHYHHNKTLWTVWAPTVNLKPVLGLIVNSTARIALKVTIYKWIWRSSHLKWQCWEWNCNRVQMINIKIVWKNWRTSQTP